MGIEGVDSTHANCRLRTDDGKPGAITSENSANIASKCVRDANTGTEVVARAGIEPATFRFSADRYRKLPVVFTNTH